MAVSKQLWKPAENPTGNLDDLISVIKASIMFIVILSVILFISDKYSIEKPPYWRAYDINKADVQNTVTAYQTDHNASLPILNGTYTNVDCSNCSVINISALLVVNGGLLHEAPDGLYLSTGGNDNCGGNVSLGCSTDASYIWIVNNDGVVVSYCAGAGCTTNNSGYQDVWP